MGRYLLVNGPWSVWVIEVVIHLFHFPVYKTAEVT